MTTINDPLPNGAPRNRHGIGGEIGHLARQARPAATARLLALLEDASPLGAGAALDAARVALAGSDKGLKVAAMRKLHALVLDPKTPPAVAVGASELLLARCGRKARNLMETV